MAPSEGESVAVEVGTNRLLGHDDVQHHRRLGGARLTRAGHPRQGQRSAPSAWARSGCGVAPCARRLGLHCLNDRG